MALSRFRIGRGRGLRELDMAALTRNPSNAAPSKNNIANVNTNRLFGTELTNQGQLQHANRRKRTFKQLQSDQENKEEEDGVHRAKRTRYNLRSRPRQFYDAEKIFGHKVVSKPVANKDNSTDDEEEDIDLLVVKKPKNTKLTIKPKVARAATATSTTSNDNNMGTSMATKPKVSKPKLRRSVRIAAKRSRYGTGFDNNQAHSIVLHQPMPPLQYIVDKPVSECDAAKAKDDRYVVDYVEEIVAWYGECESSKFQQELIRYNYISSSFQSDLNEQMRTMLLNWLIRIHRRFKLTDRTLYLGVYILDAYLSLTRIRRRQLQLIGCTAMWIAGKYHEIYAPEANDFAYYSEHSFNMQAMFAVELKILCALKFRFADIMTPLHFLERYLHCALHPLKVKYNARGTEKAKRDCKTYVNLVTQLSFYFNELSLFDCKMLSSQKPSRIAAAALCFAILSISLYPKWPQFLHNYTSYSYNDLKPLVRRMDKLRVLMPAKECAVRKRHPSIHQWLDQLNIKGATNNKC